MSDIDEEKQKVHKEPEKQEDKPIKEEENGSQGPTMLPNAEKWDYMKLTRIKGIGLERVKDLGRIYNSEKELVNALKEHKVPLRNDIVNLLEKHFNIK